MTTATIEELKQRRDLLAEINQLAGQIDEDEMEAAASYVANLREIKELDAPSEDDMKEVGDYVLALRESAELDAPSDEEMKEASDHLATLREIEAVEDGA